MTDQSAQEPTMEEILASIRRIISEDDAPTDSVAVEAAPDEAEDDVSPALMDTPPSMEADAPADEDVLDLTDRYEAPAAAAESIGDLDVVESEPAPAAAPAPARKKAASAKPDYDNLVGESAAASAASAFAGLAASLKPEDVEPSIPGPSIEDVVRALLRPMLKHWLDANLPGIVETEVRKEVERIARR